MSKPKILLLDIETAPILASVWNIWNINVGLNQIERDSFILSWAAKWLDASDSEVMYMDQSGKKDIEDDKQILVKLRNLLDECDVLITQNGKKFDEKRINTRLIVHGIKRPSGYQHVDTLQIARSKFGFTSNSLEFLCKKLDVKYKKKKHKKFPGQELWTECLKGNKAAWKEMEEYNKYDVLALQGVFKKFEPWVNPINYNIYRDDHVTVCGCGSQDMKKKGFQYTSVGKFQRYMCLSCGAQFKDRVNLLSKEKRKSLKVKV